MLLIQHKINTLSEIYTILFNVKFKKKKKHANNFKKLIFIAFFI